MVMGGFVRIMALISKISDNAWIVSSSGSRERVQAYIAINATTRSRLPLELTTH
jgi:hypothetical protein